MFIGYKVSLLQHRLKFDEGYIFSVENGHKLHRNIVIKRRALWLEFRRY